MDLRTEATRAAQIADAFSKFRDPVFHDIREINTTIAELNTLSNALRQTDDLLRVNDGRTAAFILEDVRLVCSSIVFTFEDIWATLGNMDLDLSPNTYRQAWKEISRHCQTQGQQSLGFRLGTYRRFLQELCVMLGRRSPNQRRIEYLRTDIRNLLENQDRRLITAPDAMADLRLAPIAIPRPKSYERDRPPSSPTESRDSHNHDFMPPFVPEAPTSPTGTFSSVSWSSSAGTDTAHWAREIFRNISTLPSTPFAPNPDQEISKCVGRVMQHTKKDLDRKYEELFQITFDGGLCVRLYHRERDHGAKILCETPERSGHAWYSCLSLDALDFHRTEESTLYLCQPSGSDLRAWAILYFTTIEKLVLFYSTLLSMRSHDSGMPFSNISDHELKGEDCFFSGIIRDDNYDHALRIYHDRYTKSVRLLASILDGNMKHTPVWTAFVTHSIHSPTWQRRARQKVVYLKELRRHVFSPRYEPLMAATGEHVLEFYCEEDAADFMQIVEQLAVSSRRPRSPK